jgi:hypothetical protein
MRARTEAVPRTALARKLKKEKSPAPPQATPETANLPKIGDPNARAHLEKGIGELQGLHKLLLSSEVDPDVLADFRNALNRVRTAAWAAQQYVIRKEGNLDSISLHSLLVGARIRAAYQLCQALGDDLKRTDIEFQRGTLIELHEATKNLAAQLKHVVDKS